MSGGDGARRVLQGPRPSRPVDAPPPRILDDRLPSVLPATARMRLLYDGATWAEGPVWWPQERALVFSDVVGRRTLAWREDGSVETVVDPSAFANGNAVDAQGRLLHCEHGRRALSRTDATGTHVLVDRCEGRRFNSPNDLVVRPDGGVWFTDPCFGIDDPREGYPAESELGRTSVYRWHREEGVRRILDLEHPNGLGFSPDGRRLYVAETPPEGAPRMVVADVDGDHVGEPRYFTAVDAGFVDGFAVDSRGWLWVSSGTGVVVLDETGARLGLIPTPHLTANCAFDDREERLFVVGDTSLWVLDLRG